MSSIVSFNKVQFIVHALPGLCYDVCDIINSFLFYNKKEGETRNLIKSLKRQICRKFFNAGFSRFKPRGGNEYGEENGLFPNGLCADTSEQWAVCLTNYYQHRVYTVNQPYDIQEAQFQGHNCSKCGKYNLWVHHTLTIEYPNNHPDKLIIEKRKKRLMCSCV